MRSFCAFVGVLSILSGCDTPPVQPIEDDPRGRPRISRVRDCDGPATSLPAELAATLAPRTGQMMPDDAWADLAMQVPGGFAGVLYDSAHRPVLMLTDPTRAAEAKAALAPHIHGFDIHAAVVRPARWDFAQLVDWYNYLIQKTPLWRDGGLTMGDKDESANRIYFGVIDKASRDRVAALLNDAGVPCDLVQVGITGPITFR